MTPSQPPPRRVSEEKTEPMSEIEANVRETIARHPGYEPELERLVGLLDASRAETESLRRYAEESAIRSGVARGSSLHWAGEVDRLRAENAEMRRALEEIAKSGRATTGNDALIAQAALRAAEKAPEARCGAEYGNACEGHGCPVHAGGEPEAREPAPPTAEGLTAEEWKTLTGLLGSAFPVAAPLDEFAVVIAKRAVFAEMAVRVRAAAEKAGGENG